MSNLKKCVYKLHQNEIINKNLKFHLLLMIEMKETNKLYTINRSGEKLNLNVKNKKIINNKKLLEEINGHLNYRNHIVNLKNKFRIKKESCRKKKQQNSLRFSY